MEKEGFEFVGYMLTGLVGDFPEDSAAVVVTIFRSIALLWSTQLIAWLPPILQQLPPSSAPNQAKERFLLDVTKYVHLMTPLIDCGLSPIVSALNTAQYDKVKYCILGLHRASRKARDRRRVTPLNHT
jgi:transportin-3